MEAIWDEELASAETDAREGGDSEWLPLDDHVRGLERTRLRAINLASRQKVSTKGRSGLGRTETFLESADGSVVGKIDAIDRVEGQVCVRDFKSGRTDDARGGLDEAYVAQMLLYSCLYHESSGSWPDRLELIDSQGKCWPVPFTPEKAQQQMLLARTLLESARAIVASTDSLKEKLQALAKVGEQACATCSHRPACPAYLARLAGEQQVSLGSGPFDPMDLMGVLDEVQGTADGKLQLHVRCGDRRFVIGRFSSCGGLIDVGSNGPESEPPSVGDEVAIFGARPVRPVGDENRLARLFVGPGTRAFRVAGRS